MRQLAVAIAVVLASLGMTAQWAAAEGDDASGTVTVKGGSGTFTGAAKWKESRKGKSKSSNGTSSTKKTKTTSAPKETTPTPPPMSEEEWTYKRNCWAQTRGCFIKTKPTNVPDEVTQVDPEDVAREVVAVLQLPDPTPQIGPDPSANEWNMVAVGYPLWLWTNGARQVTTTVSRHGITFTLTADWRSTTFDMGDGHEFTCTATKKYTSSVRAGAKSPKCGYTYAKASLPKGKYRVTATTNWRITWSALGESGSLPGSHSAGRDLPVGELNALVVG